MNGTPPGPAWTALLFVPADRPDRFEKARAAGAAAVIIDLEDAVAPMNRARARSAARAALDDGLPAFIRINAPQSADGQYDLAALHGAAPLGIMIAKCAQTSDLSAVRERFPSTPLVALIESIAGIEHLAAIAGAPGVAALAFGAYDLCAELGARPTAEVLAAWRSRIVFAARAAGCRAIDTPYLDLADAEGLAADARRAVDFGFDGKMAVHPKQIAAIRAAFRPAPHEVQRARRVIAAVGDGGVGVADGTMIDRPLLLSAQRVLERDRAG